MWATDKQKKFIRSLILKNGEVNSLNRKTLIIDEREYLLNSNHKSMILGGIFKEQASFIINALLNNNFKIV